MKKSILFTLTLLSYAISGYAQEDIDKDYASFVKSFTRQIYYPTELVKVRKPLFCLVKIETDTEKNVKSISVSDSADSTFVAQFNGRKHQVSFEPLSSFLKKKYALTDATSFFIPLSFSLSDFPQGNQTLPIDILNKYYKFGGVGLLGNTVFLDAITIRETVPKG